MNKTTNMMIGILAVLTAAGCGKDEALPPKPDDLSCREYEFDYDDGVWECDDRTSRYYGHYFYGGTWFGSRQALHAYAPYQKYKQSPQFKKGFGSGSAVSGS